MNLVGELTSIMLGGIIWDGIKQGANLTVEYLKSKITKWIVDDKDCENIVRIVNKAPSSEKRTELYLKAFLDDNNEIKEIIEKININTCDKYIINQTHNGIGDNVGNSKNIWRGSND